jgi:Holin of 3TMs, for gene-transfer release
MGLLGGLLGNIGEGIAKGGIKGVFEGIGSLAKDIRSAITGEISPEKKAEIENKLVELESMAQQGQVETNKVEAASTSVFVSGWRPAIGWICGISIGSYFIPQYVLAAVLWTKACWVAGTLIPYPIPEPHGLLELIIGMLGLGIYRTVEKRAGVARN